MQYQLSTENPQEGSSAAGNQSEIVQVDPRGSPYTNCFSYRDVSVLLLSFLTVFGTPSGWSFRGQHLLGSDSIILSRLKIDFVVTGCSRPGLETSGFLLKDNSGVHPTVVAQEGELP